MERARQDTMHAIADRRGGTAMEYALIAAALASLVIAGFTVFYQRVEALILSINP